MSKYTHFFYEQRIKLDMLLKKGISIKEISKELHVHRSTIYRELKRNGGKRGGYNAREAECYARERRRWLMRKRKLTDVMEKFIREKLEQEQWSPQQIEGYCKVHGMDMVSHETIYRYIWEDKKRGGTLYKHLRIRSKKYRKRYGKKDHRGKIPNKRSIEERPCIVEQKARVGDWEVDTLLGKGRQGRLITMVERKSYFTVLAKVEKGHAREVKKQIINALAPYKDKVHTLTSDNGLEFTMHESIAEKLNAEFYFTHPYSAWEKGLCENTNGLIRQYIPRTVSIREINPEQLAAIQKKLNTRPRKNLNWKTPMQVFMTNFVNQNVALDT